MFGDNHYDKISKFQPPQSLLIVNKQHKNPECKKCLDRHLLIPAVLGCGLFIAIVLLKLQHEQ
jgi:hypothetical protein